MPSVLSDKIQHRLSVTVDPEKRKETATVVERNTFSMGVIARGGDAAGAMKELHPEMSSAQAKRAATSLMRRADVRNKILELLPTDEQLAGVIKDALDAPAPPVIRWNDKHSFVKTALEMKGYLNGSKPQVNIGLVYRP